MSAEEPKVRVAVVVGTRPEVIKMAPLIARLRSTPWCDLVVVRTGQHLEIFDQMARVFGITADEVLELQTERDLASKLGEMLEKLQAVFVRVRPAMILAQGDTLSTLAASMVAFLGRTPFGHVEAGLRTDDLLSPFPEEFSRIVASYAATLHFAPTERARRRLLKEERPAATVFLTGNTIVDAVHEILGKPPSRRVSLPAGRKIIVVTAHRRENYDAGLDNLVQSLVRLSRRSDAYFVWPVHPSPVVQRAASLLRSVPNVSLVDPMPYDDFIALLRDSYCSLTDSGGIQEESSVLGKPVLIMRDSTERPEVIDAGGGMVVGTDAGDIEAAVANLLDDVGLYQRMSGAGNVFGDGRSAERIVDIMATFLNVAKDGRPRSVS